VLKTAPVNHRIVGSENVPISSLCFFITDHNPAHNIASTNSVTPLNNIPPERSIFGLPHPYRFSSLDKKVSYDFVPAWQQGDKKGRRSSPLFIHITAFTDNQGQARYRPLLLLLPVQFLPSKAQLAVSVDKTFVGNVPLPTNYKTISTFLSTYFTKC